MSSEIGLMDVQKLKRYLSRDADNVLVDLDNRTLCEDTWGIRAMLSQLTTGDGKRCYTEEQGESGIRGRKAS